MIFCRLLILSALLAASGMAVAATFTANSSLDAPDNNPGDGLCRSDFLPASTCTLRAAIMEATALAGSHTINLQSGRVYTLSRPHDVGDGIDGALRIANSMTIQCPGCAQRPIVNGDGVSAVLRIVNADNVMLSNFDITGGESDVGEAFSGGIEILPTVGLTRLEGMRLYGNRFPGSPAMHIAGNETRVTTSEIFNNERTSANGSTAIGHSAGLLVISESAIYGNSSSEGAAGAAVISSALATAQLQVRNTTISGNLGGGILAIATPQVTLRNATIVDNTGTGLSLSVANPGVATITLRNSIVARNGLDCQVSDQATRNTDGHNLLEGAGCLNLPGVSNLRGLNPLLTPLVHRSSLSLTPIHWPRRDSPAMSAGAPNEFGETACESGDQNGTTRPQGYGGPVRCDIGAAELDASDVIFYDSLEVL